jgi:two-component system chemotaxis sensor kinase CheA
VKDIRQRLLATFQIEHKEHVERIRETLATVEAADGRPAGPELDEAFRRAHSLKGAARAVDLRPLEGLAHRLETLFSRIREQAIRLDKPVIRVIAQALDASEDWLAAMSGGGKEPAMPAEALEAIDALLGTPAQRPLEKSAPVTVPGVATVTASESATAVRSAPAIPSDTLRLRAESLDRIVTSAGQLLTEGLRQNEVTSQLRQASLQLAETVAERNRARRSGAGVFQRLDSSPEFAVAARYVNFLDHQIHVLTKEVGAVLQLQERNTWALRALAGELQHDIRQARMVPAENVFDGFRKMVRDLARDAGKAIDLHLTGLHVEADRTVLQALKDPVMHMLRNAVSHGLESETERRSRGKNPEGRIDLTLDVHGTQLRCTVEDDGRGVDLRKVSETAVRKGLIAEAEIAARAPADLLRLILLPGFSTATSVTDLSGRGMGLSVAAQAIGRLQGTIDVGAGSRGGTRITMTVPVSVSTHRLLLVTCQNRTLAIPLQAIERLRRIALADMQTVHGRPVVEIEGERIPLVSLAHLLNPEEPAVTATQNSLCVMVVRGGDRRLAVAVDAFLAERDAIIKDLPAPANVNAQILGATLLEDASVCLVLNGTVIVESSQHSMEPLVLAAAAEPPAIVEHSIEILVVDDSLTTRTLEKSVLEAHGYQVAIAVDGVDALNRLRAGPVGLVISDVQMPRLDGFGLLEEMKRDPRLANIPVVIVSSLEDPEDQARGLTLGADAYIVKRKFDQHELLETVRQIL